MEYIKTKHAGVLKTIKSEGEISEKTNADIAGILEEFIPQCGLTLSK